MKGDPYFDWTKTFAEEMNEAVARIDEFRSRSKTAGGEAMCIGYRTALAHIFEYLTGDKKQILSPEDEHNFQ